MTILDDKIIRM